MLINTNLESTQKSILAQILGETVDSGGTCRHDNRSRISLPEKSQKYGTVVAHFMVHFGLFRDFGDRKIFGTKGAFSGRANRVLKVGLEPTQSFPHMPLKHACLPVPPLQQ